MTKTSSDTSSVNLAAMAARTARPDVVAVRGLVKTLGHTRVLDGVDLTVRRGETHVVLGPTGAGKTTLVETLVGAVHPDSGEIRVLGSEPACATASWHHRLACVHGEPHIWADLTGGELIANSAQIHGGIDLVARNELIDLFRIDLTKHGHNYTPGERRKVALIAALAAAVELIILDEPTAGLDPRTRRELVDWLRAHRPAHRALLLTGRDLAEAEAVADRVSVLDRGRLVACGTVDDLRGRTRTGIRAELDDPDPALADLPYVHNLAIHGDTVRCETDTLSVPDLVRALLDHGLRHLDTTAPTLDQLVRALAD